MIKNVSTFRANQKVKKEKKTEKFMEHEGDSDITQKWILWINHEEL